MTGARFLKPALIALSLLPVAACVSLLPESEPVSVYRLSSPEPREWAGNSDNWTIIEIELPQAPRGLAGDDIALVRDGQSLAYVQGARWISPAPSLVQNLVIDTFNAEQNRLAPARPEDGVRADYELHLDLRQFEADYESGTGAAPTVRVRIGARLVAERGRRFVGARVFSAERRADANRTGAIVDAFDEAAVSLSREIAGWAAAATAEMPPADRD
jgi:cholesterol transport system auxiliary component